MHAQAKAAVECTLNLLQAPGWGASGTAALMAGALEIIGEAVITCSVMYVCSLFVHKCVWAWWDASGTAALMEGALELISEETHASNSSHALRNAFKEQAHTHLHLDYSLSLSHSPSLSLFCSHKQASCPCWMLWMTIAHHSRR